jgi:hypothetical protein
MTNSRLPGSQPGLQTTRTQSSLIGLPYASPIGLAIQAAEMYTYVRIASSLDCTETPPDQHLWARSRRLTRLWTLGHSRAESLSLRDKTRKQNPQAACRITACTGTCTRTNVGPSGGSNCVRSVLTTSRHRSCDPKSPAICTDDGIQPALPEKPHKCGVRCSLQHVASAGGAYSSTVALPSDVPGNQRYCANKRAPLQNKPESKRHRNRHPRHHRPHMQHLILTSPATCDQPPPISLHPLTPSNAPRRDSEPSTPLPPRWRSRPTYSSPAA